MGPSIWTAGIDRPAAIALSERAKPRAEATENSFQSFLDDAQSAERQGAPVALDEADANEEAREETSEKEEAAPVSEGSVQRPIPAPVQTAPESGETGPKKLPDAAGEGAKPAPIVHAAGGPADKRQTGVATATFPQVESAAIASKDTSASTHAGPLANSIGHAIEAASKETTSFAASDTPGTRSAPPGASPAPVVGGEAGEPDADADSHPSARGEAPAQRPRDAEQAPLAVEDEAVEHARAPQKQVNGEISRGETAYDRRVRLWVDARRQGGAVATSSDSAQPAGISASTSANGTPAAGVQRFGQSAAARGVSIRSIKGDTAAALVSRALVSRSEGSSAKAAADTALTSTAGPSNGGARFSEVASPASRPADLVAQLLSSNQSEAPDAVDQAARMLGAASRGGGRYQATLQLDPPELGAMRVQIRMHQQAVSLQVEVDSSRVHRLVERNLAQLREALAQHGIRVDRADVVVRTPDGQQAQFDRPQEQSDRGQPEFAGNGDSGGDSRATSDESGRSGDEWGAAAGMFDGGSAGDENTAITAAAFTWATESSLNLVA